MGRTPNAQTETEAPEAPKAPAKALYFNVTDIDQILYVNRKKVTVLPRATVELDEETALKYFNLFEKVQVEEE